MVEELPDTVRQTTDALDALGNTTAATGKGFAIGSAVLTSLSLLNAFRDRVTPYGTVVDTSVTDPILLAGIVLGSMLPFLFGALTMISVGLAAQELMLNVRQQFQKKRDDENAAIDGGHTPAGVVKSTPAHVDPYFSSHEWMKSDHRHWEPKPEECIEVSTKSSVREMILPGAYAILFPVLIGFLVGARMLLGAIAGSVGAGAMLAIMMANAGGAWDNAKKYIEIAHALGGKGGECHAPCVIGDTVGDPFKDTSGPALNILLKLVAVVSLTLAPFFKGQDDWEQWYYAFIPFVLLV